MFFTQDAASGYVALADGLCTKNVYCSSNAISPAGRRKSSRLAFVLPEQLRRETPLLPQPILLSAGSRSKEFSRSKLFYGHVAIIVLVLVTMLMICNLHFSDDFITPWALSTAAAAAAAAAVGPTESATLTTAADTLSASAGMLSAVKQDLGSQVAAFEVSRNNSQGESEGEAENNTSESEDDSEDESEEDPSLLIDPLLIGSIRSENNERSESGKHANVSDQLGRKSSLDLNNNGQQVLVAGIDKISAAEVKSDAMKKTVVLKNGDAPEMLFNGDVDTDSL